MSIVLFDHPAIPFNEQARVRALLRSGLLTMKGHRRLMHIADEAKRIARTSAAAITVILEDSQHIIAASGTVLGISRRSTSFCGHMIADGTDSMCILDATAEPRFQGNPFVEDGIVRFYAGVAFRDSKGFTLGALCVFDPLPRPVFTLQQKTALVGLGGSILAGASDNTITVAPSTHVSIAPSAASTISGLRSAG